jgi:hypothetical protein
MVELDQSKPLNSQAVARLFVEYWKLLKASSKTVEKLAEKDVKKFSSQLRYSELQFATIAETLGLNIVTFDGEYFSAGLAASADNFEDFDDGEQLVVVKTIEPTIVYEMKILSKGRVLVDKKSETWEDK